MKNFKGLLLGAVAASVFAAGAMVTPANADGSAVVGHKKGAFYVKSKDGNYSIIPGFKWQFDASKTDLDNSFSSRASTTKFALKRMFLAFKGRAGSPKITYGILMNLQDNIVDAYAAYKYVPEVQIIAGNYKSIGIPIGKRLSSSAGWLVNDPNKIGKSLGDRSLGFGVRGTLNKTIKYEAKLSSGQGSNGSAGFEGVAYDLGMQWQPFGSYGSFNQADYGASSKMRVTLGGGFQYMNNATGTGDFATYVTNSADTSGHATAYHLHTGVKMSGWELGVSYEHANYQTNAKEDQSRGNRNYTAVVGGSYMLVPNKIPLSASFSLHDPDTVNGTFGESAVDATVGIQRQIGVGAAYLFNGHQNKVQASWDRTSTNLANTAISEGEHTQRDHNFNLRWQLTF